MQAKIAFISYPVSNLDKAVKFYQKVLGKEPLFHREDWAEFELGGQKLALQKDLRRKKQNQKNLVQKIVIMLLKL